MKRNVEKPTSFKYNWYKTMRDQLRLLYTKEQLPDGELKQILDAAWANKYNPSGRFYNTVTRENAQITVEDYIDKFLSEHLSMSGYGALFQNQDSGKLNLLAEAVQFLLDERDRYKAAQKKAAHGSAEYAINKRNQTSVKILTNSIYGCLGMIVSALYDPTVQNSITNCGQDIITTCIYALEAYMADNVPFKDVDVLISYIQNIIEEPYEWEILKFVDEIPKERLHKYLVSKCEQPAEDIVGRIISKLDGEMVTRIYYKNHLLELMVQPKFAKVLKKYIDAPDDSFRKSDEFTLFKNIVIQFTMFRGLLPDRFWFMYNNHRKAILLSDTDSAFLYTDPIVEEISKVFDLDRKNEIQQIQLINIFMDIFCVVMDKIYDLFGDSAGLTEKDRKNIFMKNEFVYKRIMVTENKKSYAGLVTAENGIILKNPVIDIKGLSIKKSTSAKKIRDTFTDILEHDILGSEKIDVSAILKKYSDLEEDIKSSLARGELVYAIPKSISSPEEYKNPDRIDGFRGTVVWNELYPEEKIVTPDRAYLVKLNSFTKMKPILYTQYKHECDVIQHILDNGVNVGKTKVDIKKFDCDVICIPISRDTMPEFFTHLINYNDMVATNMSNGMVLLKQLGIFVSNKNNTQKKSNIILL